MTTTPDPRLLAAIEAERDPSRLMPYTKHPEAEIARAAANRVYDLTEGRKEK